MRDAETPFKHPPPHPLPFTLTGGRLAATAASGHTFAVNKQTE